MSIQSTSALLAIFLLAACSSKEPVASAYKKSMSQGGLEAISALTWQQPIVGSSIGFNQPSQMEGNSIADILASKVAGRDDKQLCSNCHNSIQDAGGYGVSDTEEGQLSISMSPSDLYSGNSWAGAGGWADKFIENSTKPESLKAAFRAWKAGGYR